MGPLLLASYKSSSTRSSHNQFACRSHSDKPTIQDFVNKKTHHSNGTTRTEITQAGGLVVIHVPFQNEEFNFTSSSKERRYNPRRDGSKKDSDVAHDFPDTYQILPNTNNRVDFSPNPSRNCSISPPKITTREDQFYSDGRNSSSSSRDSRQDSRRGSKSSPHRIEVLRKSSIKNKYNHHENIGTSNSTPENLIHSSEDGTLIQGIQKKSSVSSDVKMRSNDKGSRGSPRVSFRVDKLIIESLDDMCNSEIIHGVDISRPCDASSSVQQVNLSRRNSDRHIKNTSREGKLRHRHSLSTILPKPDDVEIFNVYRNPCYDPNEDNNGNIDSRNRQSASNQKQHFIANPFDTSLLHSYAEEDNSKPKPDERFLRTQNKHGTSTAAWMLDQANSVISSISNNFNGNRSDARDQLHTSFTSSGDSSDTLSTVSGKTVVQNIPPAQNSVYHENDNLDVDIINKYNGRYIGEMALFERFDGNSGLSSDLPSHVAPNAEYVYSDQSLHLDTDLNSNSNVQINSNRRSMNKPLLPPKPKKKLLIDLKDTIEYKNSLHGNIPYQKHCFHSNKTGNLIKPPADFQGPCHDVYCGFLESPLSVRFEEILQNYDKISAGVYDSPRSDINAEYDFHREILSSGTSSHSFQTHDHESKTKIPNYDTVPLDLLNRKNDVAFSSLPIIPSSIEPIQSCTNPRSTSVLSVDNYNNLSFGSVISQKMYPAPLCCDTAQDNTSCSYCAQTLQSPSRRHDRRQTENKELKNFVNFNHIKSVPKSDYFEKITRIGRSNVHQLNLTGKQMLADTPSSDDLSFNYEDKCNCKYSYQHAQERKSWRSGLHCYDDWRESHQDGILHVETDHRTYQDSKRPKQFAVELSNELCPSCDAMSHESESSRESKGPRGRQFRGSEGPKGRESRESEGPRGREFPESEGPKGRESRELEGPKGRESRSRHKQRHRHHRHRNEKSNDHSSKYFSFLFHLR